MGTIATAQNQYVILYPGASNSSTILQAYLPTSGAILTKASINTLPPGTFQIIPMPDGTKYYVISNGGTPVSTMDSSFSIITQIGGSITLAPSAAALTPDGRKLVVTAGNTVYVIDTSSDTVIAQQGLTLNGKTVDIAMNLDSSRAFILSQGAIGSAGTILSAVDLTTAVPVLAGTPLTLNGDSASPATGISVAPNGFIYLSNNYRIFEVNPTTLTLTPNGEIPVQAYPGKPFITADGRFLVAANLRPIQGGTLFIQVNLATKAASGFSYTNDVLSQFFNQGQDAKGNNRLYASSTSGQLYDLTLGAAPIADKSAINNLFPSAYTFTGIQFSGENPPKIMWGTYTSATSNFLVQVDIPNQTFVQIPIPTVPLKLGTLSVSPFSGGTTLVGFNNNQTIASAKQSVLPIVAQLVDPLGRGIFRGQITFTTASPGVTIATPTFVTGSGGFAQTYVTAPATATATTFVVTANGGPGVNPLDFNFTVPGPGGPGPGTGGSQAGLYYVGGNGQLLRESQLMNVPLQVQSLDASGKPLAGLQINWSIDATQLSSAYQANPSVTDISGRAQILLQGLLGVSQSGSPTITSTVTASDSFGNAVKFVFTSTAVTLTNGTTAPDPTVGENLLDETGNPIAQFPKGRFITAAAGSVVKGAYIARITNTAGPFQGQGIQNVGACFTNADPNSVDENPPGVVAPGPTTCGKFPSIVGVSADCANNPISDASGLVSCDLRIGAKIGVAKIYPIVGQFKNLPPITLTVTAGAAGLITITSGDKQTGKPGVPLPTPLGVRVTDISGNVLSGVPIAWSVILGGTGVKLSATSSVTNVNGQASINVTLPPTPGPIKVQALVPSVTPNILIQFNLNVDAQIGSITVVSGDNQRAFPGAAFTNPLVVVIKDQQGNPLPNTQVNFAAVGAGSVSPATATTAGDGTASTKLTAGNGTGPVTVSAIVSTFQTSFTNLTVIQPGPQILPTSFVNAASFAPGLTPCGLGIIQGTGIATGVNGTLAPTGFGPNPTTLGPVQSLTIGGMAAPLTSVSNVGGVERVGFQTPCGTPVGSTTVVMNVQGGITTVNAVPVAAYSPGIFETVAPDGKLYAVALRADGSFVGPANPATRGEVIRIFVTGLGQTTPAIGTNRAGTGGQTVNAQIIAGVNYAGVLVVKAEYVAGQIGTYFVDIQIPIDTAIGPYQPIAVAVQPPDGSAFVFGNEVSIPIQ